MKLGGRAKNSWTLFDPLQFGGATLGGEDVLCGNDTPCRLDNRSSDRKRNEWEEWKSN
jgi:hypothetical protein